MDDLIIDEEFASILPATSKETDSDLERSLRRSDGPLDKIKVWKGTGIIVDGHRRYAICRRHKIPFEVDELEFDTRDEVLEWIDEFQLSRRNLSNSEARTFRMRMVRRQLRQGRRIKDVRKDVARVSGSSDRQLRRDAKVVHLLAQMPDEFAERAIEASVNEYEAKALVSMTEDQQREVLMEGPLSGVSHRIRTTVSPHTEKHAEPTRVHSAPLVKDNRRKQAMEDLDVLEDQMAKSAKLLARMRKWFKNQDHIREAMARLKFIDDKIEFWREEITKDDV